MTSPDHQSIHNQSPAQRPFNRVYVEAFAKTAFVNPTAVPSNAETNHFVGTPHSNEYFYEPQSDSTSTGTEQDSER